MTRTPLALFLVAAAATAPTAVAAEPAASSTLRLSHRFAVVIAHHDGGPGRARLQHADDDARAVRDVLVELASVDGGDVRFLVDEGKDQVVAALDGLGRDVKGAKGRGERAEVVVYYSGHSDESGLLLGRERLSWIDLRARVAAIDADVKVVVLDSCSSGAAVVRKGGTRRPPLFVDDRLAVRGQAFLTSSSADEVSQESARLGGSYFTHALVTGLRGAADVSQDGLVTLDEAYRFAFNETLLTTTTTTGGAQHANWDIQLQGAGELVITDLRDVKSRLVLGEDVVGRVYVRDARENRLLAEVSKAKGVALPLALPPQAGGYVVVVVDGNSAHEAASTGGLLRKRDFTGIDLEKAVPRGDRPLTFFPINMSFVSPLEANSFGDRVENQFGLAVLFGRSARLTGLDLSLGGNFVDERLFGAMIAVGFNGVNGPASGALLAAANVALADVTGFMGGVFNLGAGLTTGAQLGLVNVGDDVTGAQVGLINIARTATTQVGLVNISSSTTVPVGLISLVEDGQATIGVTGSDFALLAAEARVGGHHVWTQASVGMNPLLGKQILPVLGVGVGGTVDFGAARFGDGTIDLGIDIDGKVGVVGLQTANPFLSVGARLRLRPAPLIAVSVGPELRLLSSAGLNVGANTLAVADDVVFWPGFVVGLSL